MINKSDILIIIDGNALIHRSFHALPPTMKRRDGQSTNAVYGFTSFLLKSIQEFKPRYAVVTFDEAAPTFRHEAYTEYKATRTKAPDELYEQIPLTKEVLTAFNIPIFAVPGFEADDLIGTICTQVNKEKNLTTYIITGDMDTLQLVNEKVKIYTMSRGLSDPVIYDKAKIEERYGLKPEQIIDYKALRGDPSDNIPGVKGIGEKTAVEILKKHHSLTELYKNIQENRNLTGITPRILELLKEQKDNAFFSQELATIKLDCPIKFNLPESRLEYDSQKVLAILEEMEFRSLINRLPELSAQKNIEDTAVKSTNKEIHFKTINSDKDFALFFSALEKQKSFSLYPLGSAPKAIRGSLLGLGFSWGDDNNYYIDFGETAGPSLLNTIHPWLKKLQPILEDKKTKKIGHDLKATWEILKNNNLNLEGLETDTLLAAYLLRPGRRHYDFSDLAAQEFGEVFPALDELLKTAKADSIAGLSLSTRSRYGALAANLSWRLAANLNTRLKEESLVKLFQEIEMPLVTILGEMELTGIKIDKKFLNVFASELSKRLEELEKEIHELGGEFNINSPKQLKEVLFERLALPTKNIKKTKTGLSTAEDELIKLEKTHPIIGLLREYRELNKLLSTYVAALPKLADRQDRIHTTFNQTIAATGRLSSTDPNLQNIPVRTDLGKKIRQAFVAESGWKLLSFDYSQIELRLAAHLSGDKKMIAAFKNGDDIHTTTAAAINDVSIEQVTAQMRREAKATNFGILYGQGPHGLAMAADIPFAEARYFIDKYFTSYPDIKKMMDKFIADTEKTGVSTTIFGRKRELPEILSPVDKVRKAAERMAINTPIQGAAADLLKIAMIKIAEEIKKNVSEIHLLLQVHDELIFEVKEEAIEKYIPLIKELMEKAIPCTVPLIAEASVGTNWGNLKKIK